MNSSEKLSELLSELLETVRVEHKVELGRYNYSKESLIKELAGLVHSLENDKVLNADTILASIARADKIANRMKTSELLVNLCADILEEG